MRSHTLDRVSFWSLFLVIVLLPLFFLPFTNIPVEISKGALLVLGLSISLVFWAVARFFDRKIVFPKSWLLVSGFSISVVFLLSSIFSGSSQVSLFGTMFDIGSFYFILAGFILMFMSSVFFKNSKQAKILLLGTILSSAFVLIFQVLHLFMPTLLSLGILTGKTGNVLGSWNSLGFFAGFSTLGFLFLIEFFPVSRVEKILLEIFILLSILLVATVSFQLIWILLGISSLIIFVYKMSATHEADSEDKEVTKKRHFPVVTFAVFMVSFLFFISGQFLSGIISDRLQISNTEISPTFTATMSITKAVLIKNPLLGIGPNRFVEAWSMYKPQVVNNSQFWDTPFDSGSGLLPTIMATTGGLGILVWLVFLGLFLVVGVKSVFSGIKSGSNWEMMAFFVLPLYLFIASFFYFTGTVIFLLSFAFTGVFIGMAAANSEKEISISFLGDHKKSFFSILVLIIIIIFSVVASFKYMERLVSVSYFGKALTATTVPSAESYITKALSLYSNDLYLRTYSQIYLVKLSTIAKKGETLSDADKADLQTSFTQAINSARMATSYDPLNYLNFQLLGSTYQAVGSLGVKGAYSQAVLAYQNASNLNPFNPGLRLAMAGASFVDGKVEEAKDYANTALSLKQDYIDALVVLSQIAKSEKKDSVALSYAQAALALSPEDKSLKDYVKSLNENTSTSTPVAPEAKTTTTTKATTTPKN
jgi:hypothetical protein